MSKRLPLFVAGSIFLIVAIVHALRVYYGWDVQLAGIEIPQSASVLGTLVAFAMACWMFKAARSR